VPSNQQCDLKANRDSTRIAVRTRTARHGFIMRSKQTMVGSLRASARNQNQRSPLSMVLYPPPAYWLRLTIEKVAL
jgi:hypothetical protein